jgi:hypothetical protein
MGGLEYELQWRNPLKDGRLSNEAVGFKDDRNANPNYS